MAQTEARAALVGFAGGAPDVKTIGEHRVAVFSVATHRQVKGVDTTQWHRVECWNGMADYVVKHVSAGAYVKVEGDLLIDSKPRPEQMDILLTFIAIRASRILFLDRTAQNEDSGREQAETE